MYPTAEIRVYNLVQRTNLDKGLSVQVYHAFYEYVYDHFILVS